MELQGRGIHYLQKPMIEREVLALGRLHVLMHFRTQSRGYGSEGPSPLFPVPTQHMHYGLSSPLGLGNGSGEAERSFLTVHRELNRATETEP